MLESAGARVTDVSLPHTQYSIATYSVLCACEVASNMARYDGVEFGKHIIVDTKYCRFRHITTISENISICC